jgi:hypothetical protein
MFEEMKKPVKEKERLKSKAYATIMTNFGGLNVELHGDRAPKTVYNFVQLAKQGEYDNVIFHRLIPGFMVGWQVFTRGIYLLLLGARRRPHWYRSRREVILGGAVQRRVRRKRRVQA